MVAIAVFLNHQKGMEKFKQSFETNSTTFYVQKPIT